MTEDGKSQNWRVAVLVASNGVGEVTILRADKVRAEMKNRRPPDAIIADGSPGTSEAVCELARVLGSSLETPTISDQSIVELVGQYCEGQCCLIISQSPRRLKNFLRANESKVTACRIGNSRKLNGLFQPGQVVIAHFKGDVVDAIYL